MLKSLLVPLSLAVSLAVCDAGLPAHPRLLVTAADWEKLPARMEAEPAVRNIIQATVARADSVLDAPPVTYVLTGRRMLSVSREALQRVLDLATTWKVSGDRKYLERCREELLAVCAFKDWHPAHHLDTAEMQTAVAIGYDWLHAELSAEQRKAIGTALLEKGLRETFGYKSLQERPNNWNQVCMAGMVFSSIALMDIEPDLCKQAMAEARAAIKVGMKGSYAPDGAYAEGGGYWQYGTDFAILIVEALRTAGLPEAGIVSHPGFLESGRYLVQAHGTSGLLYNYGDTNESQPGISPALAWMARENRSGSLRHFAIQPILAPKLARSSRFLALAAFWIPAAGDVKEDSLPLHFLGSGHSPVAFHRTGYKEDGLFLGIKAGKADVPHGHMDAGSFVLDWAGQRWAADLGKQDYHSLEQKGFVLFQMEQESRRWEVFRLNNHTHNTLTYNGGLHRIDGKAKILSSRGAPENETLLDMSAPLGLPKEATAQRRFTMEDGTVTVTDTLESLKPGDKITWHMITRAKVDSGKDGIELRLGGKRMALDLSSPQSKSIEISPADPPTTDHDEPNPGMTRIFLNAIAGDDGKMTIKAVFRGAE
ncbi:heparinase II/III family protein [Akkermansiaceae bacterium]|nr:heparinase II/III family protein [Akkermansiaceae bacterium]